MTVQEIVDELRKLQKEWRVHPIRFGGDDEYLDGKEDGQDYCADDVDDLIRKIEGK